MQHAQLTPKVLSDHVRIQTNTYQIHGMRNPADHGIHSVEQLMLSTELPATAQILFGTTFAPTLTSLTRVFCKGSHYNGHCSICLSRASHTARLVELKLYFVCFRSSHLSRPCPN